MYFDDKTCAICCKQFETVEEHDTHYEKCTKENSIELTPEEAFDLINNPEHY
jgi:hypothetical protein